MSAARSAHPRAAVLVLLAALACGGDPSPSLTDHRGRVVAVHRPVRRVVSLAPNVTEIVAWIGGASLLAGVDDFSDFPPSVGRLPRVGGAEPSLERIVALRPDLVIGRTNGSHPSLAPALAATGIPLLLVRTEELAEVPRAMTLLGEALGIDARGARERFERQIDAQRRSRPRPPRVLVLVWAEPLYVAGRGNYADSLLQLTGAVNAVPENVRGWPQLSIEPLLASSPDIILYPDSLGEQVTSTFARDRRWKEIDAVRRGMTFAVRDEVFFRQGPRLIEAAASLNALIDRWERAR